MPYMYLWCNFRVCLCVRLSTLLCMRNHLVAEVALLLTQSWEKCSEVLVRLQLAESLAQLVTLHGTRLYEEVQKRGQKCISMSVLTAGKGASSRQRRREGMQHI